MSEDTKAADGGEGDNSLDLSDEEAQALLADSAQQGGDQTDAPDKGGDATDWKAEAEKWRSLARKHEDRAKQNAQAASKAKTVEQQLDELRSQLSERDKRELERNGRLAISQLNTRLAEAGIKRDDVAGLIKRIAPADLLADGEPNDEAIGELADALVRIAGRATPDPDQGRKGAAKALDMNQLIRRAAGVIQ